jgi:guanylate kinase
VAAGYRPIILDMVSDDTAAQYRALLEPARVKIVLLLPSFEAVDQRNSSRSPPFDGEILRRLYDSQRHLSEFDHLLDNTNLNATAVAERLGEGLFGD